MAEAARLVEFGEEQGGRFDDREILDDTARVFERRTRAEYEDRFVRIGGGKYLAEIAELEIVAAEAKTSVAPRRWRARTMSQASDPCNWRTA